MAIAPASTVLTSFNGGEASPRMAGRIDLRRYFTSLKRMTGFLPLSQGPTQAAPGTIFVENALAPCRLIPFEPYVTQGYVLELSEFHMRFYTNDGRMMNTAGDFPLQIATPWTYDQARTLDYHGSIDVMYFAGGGIPPQELRRLTPSTFDLIALALDRGPIGQSNSDETLTLRASAATGNVTITASAAVFAATDIGRLIEIEAADYSDITSWEPGIIVANGDIITWDGKVYQCVMSYGPRGTGSNPPVHDSGIEWDGGDKRLASTPDDDPYGVPWQFLYTRFGLAKITSFTSATVVQADVIDHLATSLITKASWRWALGAFSNTTGWPDAVVIWDESLVLFHSLTSTGYVSVKGDLLNYQRRDSSGDFQQDLAGQFTLPNRDQVRWMAADRVLLLGATRGEYAVERIIVNTDQPSPPQFKVTLQQSNGSAQIKPVQAEGAMLFVQRAGRKVLELAYAFQSDRYKAPDATRFADHIGAPGFVDMAWQQEPERFLWVVRKDGTLASLTYMPDEEVIGWATRQLGGGWLATSICRITDPTGERDQIWLSAQRYESTVVLRMAKIWELGDDQAEQWFVDLGLSYSGPPITHFPGAGHLEGEEIYALADGVPIGPIHVDSSGAFDLPVAASRVIAGLMFPARIVTLKLEAGNKEGTAQGKRSRIADLRLRVTETQGIRVSVLDPEAPENAFDEPDSWLTIETRVPTDPMNQAVPLYTGDLDCDTVGAYDDGMTIAIERELPTNCTLLAMIPAPEVNDE
ncbi:MAG TPA: hypothetical protein VFW22_16465 [Pseudolabrys sp.]|nr:hypothetical protein [Pseudolabrys sp.]